MTWFRRTSRGARRADERGAAAVEFAIVMPLLSILLMGIIEYGYFFYIAQSANSAAREVARQMSVGNCTGSLTEAKTYAESQGSLPGLKLYWGAAPLTSFATEGGPAAGSTSFPAIGNPLEVQVNADAQILNFIPVPNGGVVTRSVQVYVEDTTAGVCP